jgi:hypothetical protein
MSKNDNATKIITHEAVEHFKQSLAEQAPRLRACLFCKHPNPELHFASYDFHTVTIQCPECGVTGPWKNVRHEEPWSRNDYSLTTDMDLQVIAVNFKDAVAQWNGTARKAKSAGSAKKPAVKPTQTEFMDNIVTYNVKQFFKWMNSKYDVNDTEDAKILEAYFTDWVVKHFELQNYRHVINNVTVLPSLVEIDMSIGGIRVSMYADANKTSNRFINMNTHLNQHVDATLSALMTHIKDKKEELKPALAFYDNWGKFWFSEIVKEGV